MVNKELLFEKALSYLLKYKKGKLPVTTKEIDETNTIIELLNSWIYEIRREEKESANLLNQNIEYTKEWLVQEIIKTDFEQKKTSRIQYVKMTKIDLLKLMHKFIKLNEKGGA